MKVHYQFVSLVLFKVTDLKALFLCNSKPAETQALLLQVHLVI